MSNLRFDYNDELNTLIIYKDEKKAIEWEGFVPNKEFMIAFHETDAFEFMRDQAIDLREEFVEPYLQFIKDNKARLEKHVPQLV
jgi:hypothetical protein